MKRFILGLAAFAAATAVLIASAGAGAGSTPRSWMLQASGNTLPAGLAAKIQAAGGTITSTVPQVGLVFATSSSATFASNAAKIPGLRSISPNLKIQWLEPNETVVLGPEYGYPPTSGDNDTRFDLEWGQTAVDSVGAWNAGYRGSGARVAILDEGIDADHPDLASKVNAALSTSFVSGENWNPPPGFYFHHGTHVAGIVAAADNAFGTIGVAPDAELVAVKVLSDAGEGSFEDVIAGIVYAADADADVINMSLGGYLKKNGEPDLLVDPYTAKDAAELKNAIGRATTYAYQQGTTVIASAGNEAVDFDHTSNLIHLPSDAPHVITISATAPIGWATPPFGGFLDNPASYTNYGQSAIDFAAPGGDFVYPGNESCTVAGLTRPCFVFDYVFSDIPGGYAWAAGTSMATPHASGVAAIIIGKNGGDMKPAQVEARMAKAADDLGKPGNDDYYGAGRVNAAKAVAP